ncbi:hypothetical protein E4T56_gene7206 [Termitomyces sp. T112]|nr:hypothetical protein E4T56_gene7206 [Termitomyces sp. T112]
MIIARGKTTSAYTKPESLSVMRGGFYNQLSAYPYHPEDAKARYFKRQETHPTYPFAEQTCLSVSTNYFKTACK